MKNKKKIMQKWVCNTFGHKNPLCQNGCSGHGFCSRCGMFFVNNTWYNEWQDAKKKEKGV